jgi:hypothetical protein
MKTLITALALTTILATSTVAKTQRTKEARIQPNNSVVQLNDSYCHARTDPDPRIQFQMLRDRRHYGRRRGCQRVL